MELSNYKRYSILVILLLISCSSYHAKDKYYVQQSYKENRIRKLDSFMKLYLQVNNVDTFLSESTSEIDTSHFINKRFESKELIYYYYYYYYYGRLIPDGYYDDHLNNIISKERKELWGMLLQFDGYEVYELDSNRVFHEVKLDNIIVGYYLKSSIPDKSLENSFKLFLKKDFNYILECEFSSRLYK